MSQRQKVKEIAGLYDLGCFKRWARFKANSIIDAHWVITWTMIEGSVGVHCKLAVRGFKGKFQDLDTYAGATSRSGQRLTNAVAVGNKDFLLFNSDVSQAFAKGLAFEDFSAVTGQQIRKVEFDVPKVDLECPRQLYDFNDFDSKCKTLLVLKPIYGLKNAPRAWRKKLHEVLTGWMSCRQLYSELDLYCVHRQDDAMGEDIMVPANQHIEEQQEIGKRQVSAQECKPGNFKCLLSVHVDGSNVAATKDVADGVLKHLNDKVGQCKTYCTSFLHTGIQYESALGDCSHTDMFILAVSHRLARIA